MSIAYSIKAIDTLVTDKAGKRYSDPLLNGVLATGEKFYLVARASNVGGTAPSLSIAIELSNDGVNWGPRGSAVISGAITVGGTTYLTGFDDGVTNGAVGGRFMRVSAALTDAGTPGAHVEVWVCGRSLV